MGLRAPASDAAVVQLCAWGRSTHLSVDLVPAADGAVVVCVEDSAMRPGVLARVEAVLGLVSQHSTGSAANESGTGCDGANHLGGHGSGGCFLASGGVGLGCLHCRGGSSS